MGPRSGPCRPVLKIFEIQFHLVLQCCMQEWKILWDAQAPINLSNFTIAHNNPTKLYELQAVSICMITAIQIASTNKRPQLGMYIFCFLS